MGRETINKESLQYCALDSFKNDFAKACIFILIGFPVMCILLKCGPFSPRLLPYTIFFLFFFCYFFVLFHRAKKVYETIQISEEKIRFCLPGKAPVEILWSESVSVGSFSGSGLMKLTLQYPGQRWYELVLSSEKISPLYQMNSILHFSPDEYAESGSWRVSLGRGNQKWCQKQIELIEGMKQKALLNKLS